MTRAVVESLAVQVAAEYVFPEVGRKVAKGLRDRAKQGRYDSIGQAKELADTLNADLRTLAHDLHLRLHYSHRPLPATAPNADSNADHLPDPAEQARVAAPARRMNHGFDKVQRLAGNVGYMELRAFDGSPEAGRSTSAEEALKTAHVMALTNLQAKTKEPELKGRYDRALDQAKNAPAEPVAGLGGPAGAATKR